MVQRKAYEAVDMQFFDAFDGIFKSQEWLYQGCPIPRGMLRWLCPRSQVVDLSICPLCRGVTFPQASHALEHSQWHFWNVSRPGMLAITGIPYSRKAFLRKNELENHSNTHAASGHVPSPSNW